MNNNSNNNSHLPILIIKISILVLLVLSYVYSLAHSFSWPLIHDAPIMHFVAKSILSGKAPYKDIFDMNLPGTYWIHMFVINYIGSDDFSWRLFDLIVLFITAISIVYYCLPNGKWTAFFASILYVIAHHNHGAFFLGQRDFLIAPFLILGGLNLAKYLENNRNEWLLFLSGLMIGFAMIIKPIVLLLLIFFIFFLILKTYKAPKQMLKEILFFVAGSLVFPVIALIWLISIGAYLSFFEIVTQYLPLYSSVNRVSYISLLIGILRSDYVYIFLLVLFFFIEGVKPFNNLRFQILIVGLLYGLFHFILQGKGWSYHTYPFYSFLFPLMGITINELMNNKKLSIKTSAIMCIIVIILPLINRARVIAFTDYSNAKPLVKMLVNDISNYSLTNNDTVQVLDTTDGGINALYLLGIQQPTRFIYDFHFFHNMDNPYIINIKNEFINDLTTKKPKLIVVFHKSWGSLPSIERLNYLPEFIALLNNR